MSVRHLVSLLPDQAALNAFLLQVDDVGKRKVMFEYVKPWIRFPNPQFPTLIETFNPITREIGHRIEP
jgi:hypothetical protein